MHRFVLEPQTTEAKGKCSNCGEVRMFNGGVPEASWDAYSYQTATNKDTRIPTDLGDLGAADMHESDPNDFFSD